jgi:uncharacterized membrane protein YgcG
MLHQGSVLPQMESDDKASKGDRETRTSDYLLQCALEVCFMQMEEALYHKAVAKVADLCFTNLLFQQQAQLGVLIDAICAVDPQYVVDKMVPLCLRILLEHDSQATPRSGRTPASGRTPSSGPRTSHATSSWSAAAAAMSADKSSPKAVGASKSPGQAGAGAGGGCSGGGSPGSAGKSSGGGLKTPATPTGKGALRLAALSEMELVYYLKILEQVGA